MELLKLSGKCISIMAVLEIAYLDVPITNSNQGALYSTFNSVKSRSLCYKRNLQVNKFPSKMACAYKSYKCLFNWLFFILLSVYLKHGLTNKACFGHIIIENIFHCGKPGQNNKTPHQQKVWLVSGHPQDCDQPVLQQPAGWRRHERVAVRTGITSPDGRRNSGNVVEPQIVG